MESQDEQTTGARAAGDRHAGERHADIYGEDGVIRSSFLAHIGAAIADRDTLTLQARMSATFTSRNLATCSRRCCPSSAAHWSALLGARFRLFLADRGRRGDSPRHRRQSAQRADRPGGAGTRFRRRGLHPRRPRRGRPGRDPGAAAVHRAHPAAPFARLSGGDPPAGACRRSSSPCRRSGPSARPSTTCARTRIFPTVSARSSSSIRPSSCSAPSTSTRSCAPSGR